MVVPPAVTLSKPVNVLANFTFNALPSDTTPILLSVKFAAAAPPLMLSLSPNCLLITAPLSPSKLRPLAIVVLIVEIAFLLVAISCVFCAIFCLFCAISVVFLPISVVFLVMSVVF